MCMCLPRDVCITPLLIAAAVTERLCGPKTSNAQFASPGARWARGGHTEPFRGAVLWAMLLGPKSLKSPLGIPRPTRHFAATHPRLPRIPLGRSCRSASRRARTSGAQPVETWAWGYSRRGDGVSSEVWGSGLCECGCSWAGAWTGAGVRATEKTPSLGSPSCLRALAPCCSVRP